MFFRFFEKDALQHSLGNLNILDGMPWNSFNPKNWTVIRTLNY